MSKLVALGLSLVLVAGCAATADETTTEAPIGKPVETSVVVARDFTDELYVVGKLAAVKEYDIMIGQMSTVKEIRVDVGDTVKEGDLLFTVKNESLRNKMASDKSSLKSQMDKASLDFQEAEKSLNQNKALYENDVISKKDYDAVENQFNQAKLGYNNAKNSYDLTMKTYNDQVKDTYYKSPVTGVVAAKYIEEKQDIGNGIAMKIVDMSTLVAKVNVPESSVTDVKVGQKVMIYSGGDSSEVSLGKVKSVDLVTGENSSLYPVEILITETDHRLKSGMYVEASIITDEKQGSVSVPKKAIINKEDETYVFVAKEDKAEKRLLVTGLVQNDYSEVISGVKTGEQLIVKGNAYLNEGDLITVVE